MRYFIIIISLLFAVLNVKLYAADSRELTKKKLLIELSRTQENDTMRLVILNKLVMNSQNPQVELYYIDRLLKESVRQKNKRYICEAYLNRMILAYNQFDVEEVDRGMKKLEPIARKEKYYDLLFKGKRCVVDMLMLKGEYELEEKEAIKMLDEAINLNTPVGIACSVQSLAAIYRQTSRHEAAAELLEKYYPVAMKTDRIFDVGNYLIATYSEMDDYPNTLKWLRIQENAINKYVEENPQMKGQVNIWLLMTYIYYLSYYGDQKNIPMAEKYLKLANEYLLKGYSSSASFYHIVRYRYFYNTKQFERALGALNDQMEIFRELNPLHYISLIFMKADLLNKIGREDDAIAIYQTAFEVKDSIQVAHINMQTEQLKKDYDADRLILEKEKIDKYMQIFLLILIIVVSIILIAFVVHGYRVQGRLKISEEEMRRMSLEMEQANISKERFLSNISKLIRIPLDVVVDGAKQLSQDQDMQQEERKKLAEHIDFTSTGLMKLVNNILDFSRLEAGMMKYNASEVGIVSLVRNILANITAETGQAISVMLPEMEIQIHIDSNKLQSILNNLFSVNESMPDRKLSLTLERVAEGSAKVAFLIEGTVLGIIPRTQDIVIMNEINRMIVAHFGGTYEVHSSSESPSIRFTL